MQALILKLARRSGVAALSLTLILRAEADTVFSDNFDSRASPLWGNESGRWSAAGGTYHATSPRHMPAAISSLPHDLTNFWLDVDIDNVVDGGVWLRSSPVPGTSIGIKGVLLNLKVPDRGPKIYWHIVSDGNDYGVPLNVKYNAFPVGEIVHVHIEVSGTTYAAFLNGSSTPATVINTCEFSSGQVALYDFSGQSFDNVLLQSSEKLSPLRVPASVPEPVSSEKLSQTTISERPTLNLQSGVVVSWPATFTGYTLEQNSDPSSTNWIRVTNPVSVVNQVILPPPAENRFFRLSTP